MESDIAMFYRSRFCQLREKSGEILNTLEKSVLRFPEY